MCLTSIHKNELQGDKNIKAPEFVYKVVVPTSDPEEKHTPICRFITLTVGKWVRNTYSRRLRILEIYGPTGSVSREYDSGFHVYEELSDIPTWLVAPPHRRPWLDEREVWKCKVRRETATGYGEGYRQCIYVKDGIMGRYIESTRHAKQVVAQEIMLVKKVPLEDLGRARELLDQETRDLANRTKVNNLA